jgi:hypothetical protein
MCLCCETKAKVIRRDILPGYNLLKGMVDHPDWPLGHYALQKFNDPDFIFKEPPRVDPSVGVCLNNNKKAYEAFKIWAAESEHMEESFVCAPEMGYPLYKACLKAGWRPKRDGYRLVYWLRNYMGKKLKRK